MTPGVCNCGSASLLSLTGLFSFLFLRSLRKVYSWSQPYFLNILTFSCSLFTSYLIILFPFPAAFSTPSFFWVCVCVHLTIFSKKMRAHFGQNQLTQKSLYNPCSYEPCKCKLKNDVCGVALLLGFPEYSGQIVFARHYERHYPSFWMSSVIGIIGAKVQKLTLRVIALQVGLSDEIRGWVYTMC